MDKKIFIALILTFILISLIPASAMNVVSTETKEVNGIKYSFIKAHTEGGQVYIHLIEADPAKCQIGLALAQQKIGYSQSLGKLVKNYPGVLAAINGTFFCMDYWSLPISNIRIDGRMVYLNNIHRTNCGITKDGKMFFGLLDLKGKITISGTDKSFFIWGMNRPKKTNEVIVYTKEWGKTTETSQSGMEIIVINNIVTQISKSDSQIPENGFVISLHGQSKKLAQYLPIGQKIELSFSLTNEWANTYQLFTGGPRLLAQGKVATNKSIYKENFGSYLLCRHPRTAVGMMKNGHIVLIVVDGRSYTSAGATYEELAYMMMHFGVTEAMGLDGGNSSIMWFNGQIVNNPSGGGRAIPNAIITLHAK